MEYSITEDELREIIEMLGNGWYHQIRRTEEGDLDYGFPKLCFELLITD